MGKTPKRPTPEPKRPRGGKTTTMNDISRICPTTGKTQYKSEQAARKGLERFRERMPDYEGEPYLCMYCGQHHFGKPAKRKK